MTKIDTSAEAVGIPHDEPRQIVCTGEAGSGKWNAAFGTWEADDFGMASDEPVGDGERLFVNRHLYDAIAAERDALRKAIDETQAAYVKVYDERDALAEQLAEARNAALDTAKAAIREECLAPEGTFDMRTEAHIANAEAATVDAACEAIEALKSEPTPRADRPVHTEIAVWPHFPGGVTGQWSANTYDVEDAVIYVPKDG
jgi:chorismate mutase